MKNFWKKLPKNFTCLAPMAGVTDFPFREIISEIGKPDVFITEFVSTEGLWRSSVGNRHACSTSGNNYNIRNSHGCSLQYEKQLKFSKKQRPIVAQFFGCRPEQFEYCAALVLKLGFDGIDINMGCPDRKVLKQGSGSELIRKSDLVVDIINATKRGCKGKLPVSVKTRLGYEKKDLEWIRFLLKQDIDALTIHARTAKQGYTGSADWDAIGEVVKMRNKMKLKTLIIGNGDIKDLKQGQELSKKYGTDGFMVGRQLLRNPWIFSGKEEINLKLRVKTALKHTRLFEKFYGSQKDFGLMKKYYKAYFSGVHGDLFSKKELMESKSINEARKILTKKP